MKEFTNEELKIKIMEITRYWTNSRRELRQILYENGVNSNPGWTEEDILNGFKTLLYKQN